MTTVSFNICSASALNKWKTTIGDTYTKDKVMRIVNSLPFWGDGWVVTVGHDNLGKEYERVARKKTAATKDEYVDILARMMATEDNRRILWEHFPDRLREIMRLLNDNIFITTADIRRMAGLPARPEAPSVDRYYRSYTPEDNGDISQLMSWMLSLSVWSINCGYYYVPATVLTSFPALHPAPMSQFVVGEAPSGLRRADFESEVFPLITVLGNMYDNGIIERGRAKLTAAQINRVVKMLGAKEFYPEADEKTVRNWRTILLANAYAGMRNGLPVTSVMSPLTALGSIFNGLMQAPSTRLGFLPGLLFLKISRGVARDISFPHMVKTLVSILRTLGSTTGAWLLTEGIVNEMHREPGGVSDLLFFRSEALPNSYVSNAFSGNSITPATQVEQAGLPVLHSLLALMASLGVLELAYDDIEPDDDASPMPFIRAVRVTPLGRYMLGLDDSYTPPREVDKVYFELDPERLIIRALEDNNPYEPLLKDFSRPIGARRYVVTSESFLSGCNSMRDINSRIELFRQTISADVPPNWQLFFTRMREAESGFSLCNGYTVCSIDPSRTDLIEALTTDSELRRIVIRAEGYRILVADDDMAELRARLKRYGYLIPRSYLP